MKNKVGQTTLLARNIYNLRDFIIGIVGILLLPLWAVLLLIDGLVGLGREVRWGWRR